MPASYRPLMKNTSSVILPQNFTPWFEHNLQITTPEHRYLDGDDQSEDERLNYASAPLPRALHSCSVSMDEAGDVFIFGGMSNVQFNNDTWRINVSGGSDSPVGSSGGLTNMSVMASLVETTGTVPTSRVGHMSTLVDGQLIVWGGVTSLNAGDYPMYPDDNSVYSLNLDTKIWNKLTTEPSPSARRASSACMSGKKFIVFGGSNTKDILSDLWSLDLSSLIQGTLEWEQIEIATGTQAPQARMGHTMVSYQDKLYVFGGHGGGDKPFYNDTWCFDTSTRSWTELTCTGPTPAPRRSHAATLVGDAVYVFGGEDEHNKKLGDTWSFRISEQKWYRVPDSDLQPLARAAHIMAQFGRNILILGGLNEGTSGYTGLKTAHILDTSLIDYTELADHTTLNLTQHVEQSCSITSTCVPWEVSGAFEQKRFKMRNDGSGINKLTVALNCLEFNGIGTGLDEATPTTNQMILARKTRDFITGAMSATEILQCLVVHGCRDVSKILDISNVTEYPISTGGFGDVYCATLHNGERVALKCIRMLVGSNDAGKKFLKYAARELYVWSKCNHPNIQELLGVMLFRGQLAMVSPWVEHGHLRWFLSQNTEANRCALSIQIANGVEYMHRSGIVHGDLKPENILVANDKTPRLTDFGNSVLSEYTLEFSQSTTTLHVSMRWTAPEIINEETKTTQAGDIYALGM